MATGLVALPLTLPGALQAARPMITDDARIVDPQSCQLEAWTHHGPGAHEYWALPGCNPWGGTEITGGGAHFSGPESSGLALLQAKTLVRSLAESSWAWGGTLGVVRKTPGGALEPYAYAPITWATVPDRLFLHLNAGARRDSASGRTEPTWGLGLEGIVTPRLGVIAEAFSQERGTTLYQGGLRVWLVPDRVQIDATAGNRWGQAPGQGPERWVSIGLRLLSPPFLR